MPEYLDANVEFLSHVGITAKIISGDDGKRLIQMSASDYERRHNMIDRWYTLVYSDGDQCCFCERARGSDDTSM